ncbi:hypothetical protein GJAV_G00006880 [Gymnothorax javanicus]|nr:hypothetical protein GJAV_G00006880 [Gymnothorax javanicus]
MWTTAFKVSPHQRKLRTSFTACTQSSGGFEIRQWASNDPKVICDLPPEARSDQTELRLHHDPSLEPMESTLGLHWNCLSDTLKYQHRAIEATTPTMSHIYRVLASQYDPLGYILPYTTRAKIIVQHLWGLKRGVCSQINHFPEDADYDHDGAEYVLRVVRASSFFPILSAILLLMGGVCIAVSRFYKSKGNIVLGAGILFVAAGLSNIIGVIVYISAALGDISPKKDEDKKWHYSYGWSFYFGGLSFILAEMVGVLAVNIYIEKNKELRCRSRAELFKSTTHPVLRLPSYGFHQRSRSSSRSTDPSRSRDNSPVGGVGKAFTLTPSALLSQNTVGGYSVSTLPNPHSHPTLGGDISLYTLSRDPKIGGVGSMGGPPMYGTVDRSTLYQLHNCFPKDSGSAGVLMTGTLPPLSKSNNPSLAQNSSNSNALLPNSLSTSAPSSQPPILSSSTGERDRGMNTLDRIGKEESSNSSTLNRKTTPV